MRNKSKLEYFLGTGSLCNKQQPFVLLKMKNAKTKAEPQSLFLVSYM